jgi:soluble lytic murein transglycosylase-like protein
MRRLRSVLETLCFGALLTLSTAASARADIYRYVDKNGVEHYTNVQPSAKGWQRIIRSPSTAPRARAVGGRASSVRAPDPERVRRYDAYIREAAYIYRLPESFVRAVMRVESNFYPEAVSHRGAMGLMQLMPGTATAMGVLDAFDPRQNVLGGARFLRVLANSFGGDLVRTIAAYNAGPGAVERYKGIPPYAETRRYVQRVLTHYYEYRELELRSTKLATR